MNSAANIKALLSDPVDARTGVRWATTSDILAFLEGELTALENDAPSLGVLCFYDRAEQLHSWVFRARINDTRKLHQDALGALQSRDLALYRAARQAVEDRAMGVPGV